ncbi:uncharacterized protein LOC131247212 [Magnolia sinica]|uniref:uncharacterized protein LOC131247212 n=1 Tax=Magnolia sinica TaxID=86752 RepID=UPI002659A935|nr:uncharacterized protein LOC131247212 [Magnolia sinica]
MEVYVFNMLVESIKATDHVTNLEEMFLILHKYQMKLNPNKCAFWVSSGKFLSLLVSQRRIEANLEKIKALLDMKSPRLTKYVQRLTGSIAALNRFVSRATDKSEEYQAKKERMKTYLRKAKELIDKVQKCTVALIPQAENSKADILAKLVTADEDDILRSISIEFLTKPSINEANLAAVLLRYILGPRTGEVHVPSATDAVSIAAVAAVEAYPAASNAEEA